MIKEWPLEMSKEKKGEISHFTHKTHTLIASFAGAITLLKSLNLCTASWCCHSRDQRKIILAAGIVWQNLAILLVVHRYKTMLPKSDEK